MLAQRLPQAQGGYQAVVLQHPPGNSPSQPKPPQAHHSTRAEAVAAPAPEGLSQEAGAGRAALRPTGQCQGRGDRAGAGRSQAATGRHGAHQVPEAYSRYLTSPTPSSSSLTPGDAIPEPGASAAQQAMDGVNRGSTDAALAALPAGGAAWPGRAWRGRTPALARWAQPGAPAREGLREGWKPKGRAAGRLGTRDGVSPARQPGPRARPGLARHAQYRSAPDYKNPGSAR
jgi:hypothetical protein